jgi:membrane protease YdiL (CAAX protease family)
VRREPSRRRAALDVGVLVALLVGLTLGAEWLARRGAGGRSLGWAFAETAAAGLALLGLSVALVWRDPDRRQALGLGGSLPWPRTLGWGLAGALGTYLASGVVAVVFMLVATLTSTPGGSEAALAAKTDALTTLSSIPWWAVVPLALFAGCYEELVFRGLLLRRLLIAFGGARASSLALAVGLSSAIFSAGHLYQGALGVVQTFAAGVCLALVASLSGSIRACIVAHVTIDAFSLFALRVLRPWLEQAAAAGG